MEGEYEFRLSSDDGAFLYIDDLEHPFISREACRGKSETKQSGHLSRAAATCSSSASSSSTSGLPST